MGVCERENAVGVVCAHRRFVCTGYVWVTRVCDRVEYICSVRGGGERHVTAWCVGGVRACRVGMCVPVHTCVCMGGGVYLSISPTVMSPITAVSERRTHGHDSCEDVR